jgi:hypothetical protein
MENKNEQNDIQTKYLEKTNEISLQIQSGPIEKFLNRKRYHDAKSLKVANVKLKIFLILSIKLKLKLQTMKI